MKRIDSRTNPIFRSLKSLLSAKGIKEEGQILVSGRKLVPEFLELPELRPICLLVSDPKDVEKLQFKKSLDVLWLAKDLFDDLDEAGTHFPILVVEAPSLARADLSVAPVGLEVVLALSDPKNLGAALRSCEAFEVSSVVLLQECAHPFLTKVLRSSSGSSLKVRLSLGPSVTALSAADAAQLTALDMDGIDIRRAPLKSDIRLFIGEEGRGVPAGLTFSGRVSIPMKKGMDSLNAVAATSVALYAYRTKFPG